MPDLRERLLRPREGWLSLGLLAVMVLALAWSVQGAAWLPQMDYLVPVALYAVVVGAVLGVLPVTISLTLPAAALVGAAIVIWTIGGEYYPDASQLGRLDALRSDLIGWTAVVVDTGYPVQMSPYALGLGMLMWATGAMAAHALYRYHRVLDAIALVGVAIVANMSATFTDLFTNLLLFVAAALLLWLRASLAARQESWQRRRVNENLEVSTSIMRSGVAFAAASVALAWILTSVAVAAPLTGAWRSLDTVWGGVRDEFENVFGSLTNPNSRISGNSFGSAFTVSGEWVSNDDEVMVVAASRPLYMRTVTYDVYNGRGWERSESTRRNVGAGERLYPAETPERPLVDEAFAIETITVQMQQPIGRNLFVPGYPLIIFAPVVLHEPGGQPMLGGVEAANSIGDGQSYQVSAALSEATEVQLAAAPLEYPPAVSAIYLDASRATERVRQLAAQVAADAGAANPYDQAKALARFLSRDESFSYETVAPVPPRDGDLVDFFLNEGGRVGYCQYYASAMVLMARTLGIPARVAVGFAPGERGDDGTFQVREANAHAWAELYFPGYGWQIFEATKTISPGFVRQTGVPGELPPTVAGREAGAIEAFEAQFDPALPINQIPGATIQPIEGGFDATTGAPTDEEEAREGNTLIFVAILIGLAVFIWVRLRSVQRRWRFLPAGDRAWSRLSFAADRAGVAPRPSETVYEYAGWLEEQIPSRRPEIRTLADGKVWQDYSGRRMSTSAAAALEAAWRRLRLPFASLTLRHWLRSLVRRRP